MKQFNFSLHVSFGQFRHHYSGIAAHVVVVSDNGQRLQLPAMRFRPFLTQSGIHGYFRLTVDDNHKFVRLEKIA